MEIEHVSGISLASRGTAQQQRDFAIRRSVLGKIVIDHQRVLAVVAEELAHGTRSVRGQVEHWRGLRCRCRNHDGVLHGAVIFQHLHHLGNRRALLPDGAVDTNQVVAFAVDYRVQRHGGLTGLTVADDELALAAANRDHGINCLDSGRHGLTHRLAINHARSNTLNRDEFAGGDRTFAIHRLTKRVHHAADHGFTGRHRHDFSCALYLAAFFDLRVITQQHRANLIFFQVHRQSRHAVPELEQFAGHDFVQAMNAGDSVAEGDDRPNFVHRNAGLVVFNLLAD